MAYTNYEPTAFNTNLGGSNKTSTAAGFYPTSTTMNQNGTGLTTYSTNQKPMSASVGVQAVSPYDNLKLSYAAPTTSQQKTQTTSSSVTPDYTLHNGESYDAYKARVAQYYTQPSGGTTGGTPTLGTGGVGQKAPAGMEYDGSGNLVPIQQSSQTSGGTTGQQSGYQANQGLYGQLLLALANAQDPNSPLNSAVNSATQGLQNLQTDYAGKTATIEGQPSGLSLQQGEEGILNRLFASKQSAAQTGLQNALTARQQSLGALGQAAGLAAPQLGQYGQAQYSPLGGTLGGSNGAGVSPNDPFYQTLQTYAGQLANNQGSSIPSSITGNPVLQAQLLQMAKQINPNFNYNTATGIGQGQQQIGATGGAIASGQTQQIAQYQSARQQAQNVGSQLTDLIRTFGLNPSDVNAVNTGIQRIAQNTSSPQYQQLNNYIQSIANLYSQILTPAGGSATDTTRNIAASMLNSSASGQSILQVMQSLDQEAQARIAGVSTTGGGSTNQFSGSAWQ